MSNKNDIYYTYFLLFILILSFILNPFCKKQASSNMSPHEYFVISHTFVTIIVIFYALYLLYYDYCKFEYIYKMNKSEIFWMTMSVIIGTIGTLVFIMLVQREEISFIMPNIQPLVILVIAIIGYFFFQESMSYCKMSGIALIILGAIFINYDKMRM